MKKNISNIQFKKTKDISVCGRSMVEILGVLAIVGVLSIGGIAGYVTASRNLRINNLKDEVSTIVVLHCPLRVVI